MTDCIRPRKSSRLPSLCRHTMHPGQHGQAACEEEETHLGVCRALCERVLRERKRGEADSSEGNHLCLITSRVVVGPHE